MAPALSQASLNPWGLHRKLLSHSKPPCQPPDPGTMAPPCPLHGQQGSVDRKRGDQHFSAQDARSCLRFTMGVCGCVSAFLSNRWSRSNSLKIQSVVRVIKGISRNMTAGFHCWNKQQPLVKGLGKLQDVAPGPSSLDAPYTFT